MAYLIGQLAVWLVLTAACAGVAGWAFAAERNVSTLRAERRERESLLRDLSRLAGAEGANSDDVAANEREADTMRRLVELRDARIAELEHQLEHARSRADAAAAELSEVQRQIAQADADRAELARLRALAAAHEAEAARIVEVEVAPVSDEPAAEELRAWRLRYFEQRVKYLEAQSTPPAPAVEPPSSPVDGWRAREAEARAAYLADEVRRLSQPVAATPLEAEPAPFASNADVDMLLRWRMLYLERRVAHLQGEAEQARLMALAKPAPEWAAPAIDPDLWKWRARYLEARVRHLEQSAPQIVSAAVEESAALAAPAAPLIAARKPPVLNAARDGAPDDLTLIEGISLLQQTTFYALGIFHFDQIAAWSPANVAWVDNYLRLGGRIDDEEWVEQAQDLAAHGVAAIRRVAEEERA